MGARATSVTGVSKALAGALALLLAAACSSRPSTTRPVEERRADLSEGIAARVGSHEVLVPAVASVAAAQKVAPDAARGKLVQDTLFALGAQDRGLEDSSEVRLAKRALLARRLLERIRDEQAAKPVTDEEVEQLTKLHWLDLDRPVARTSVHALVRLDHVTDPDKKKAGLELASRMARELHGISDPKQFEQAAKSIPHDGFDVVVETLPPITEDGRMADLTRRPPEGVATPTFDRGYVQGLFGIGGVGQVSAPVTSSYGSHVILLTGIQAEQRVAFEERRKLLTPEIRTSRARKEADALAASLRAGANVTVVRNTDEIFKLLPTAGSDTP